MCFYGTNVFEKSGYLYKISQCLYIQGCLIQITNIHEIYICGIYQLWRRETTAAVYPNCSIPSTDNSVWISKYSDTTLKRVFSSLTSKISELFSFLLPFCQNVPLLFKIYPFLHYFCGFSPLYNSSLINSRTLEIIFLFIPICCFPSYLQHAHKNQFSYLSRFKGFCVDFFIRKKFSVAIDMPDNWI